MMRDDQIKQLEQTAEALMDQFLLAADPTTWSGHGQSPVEMDPQTRGNRNWDAKMASQIGTLTARGLDLLERLRGAAPAVPVGEADDKAEIQRFEKQAREAMKRAGLPVGGKA